MTKKKDVKKGSKVKQKSIPEECPVVEGVLADKIDNGVFVPSDTGIKDDNMPESSPVTMMDISLIDETGWNLRGEESYQDEEYKGLLQSMKENGFFKHEPLLLRSSGERFQVIGGHRRFRAAKELGFQVVPVTVRQISDSDARLLILIDNFHRKDFSALEEAQGIKQVLDDGAITQTELARKMGKSQAYVANRLRLLDAPQELKDLIISQEITPSHVNVMLPYVGYPVYESIMTVLKDRLEDVDQGPLSVRDLEQDIIDGVVSEDETIFDNLDEFPYDSQKFQEFFDFSACQDCNSIVMVKVEDEEHRCCMNQGCWSVKLENAEIKWGEAEVERKKKLADNPPEQVNTAEVSSQDRKCLRWVVWRDDKKAMDECKSCEKCRPDEDGDLTCLDTVCFEKKEKAWQREANKKAREVDKQVFALMDEKLSGISCLGETELRFIILRLSTNIIWGQACKKAYKPWAHLAKKGHDYPAVSDIPSRELLHLLLRLIIIQRMNGGNGLASMDQFNQAIEGLGV